MKADSAPTQQNTLLEEGGRSYPKAMLALSQFREMVQDACIAAMKRSLPELIAALGLQLKSGQVKPYAAPDKPGPGETDGTWAELGAMLKNPGGARCTLYNYISWEDAPLLRVIVSILFVDAGIAERTWAAVRDHGTLKKDKDENEINSSRRIDAAGLASLPSTLDEMNTEWIQLWKGVGGVKQFLEKR